MAFVKVQCKKCKGFSKMDIGPGKEAFIDTMKKCKVDKCLCGQCELEGPLFDNINIFWDQVTEDLCATESEFLNNLHHMFKKCYEPDEFYKEHSIDSNLYGRILATNNKTGEMDMFAHIVSPEGKIYYCKC